MPNRAVNQFPLTAARQTGDLFYIVRSCTDYKLEQEAMAPQVIVEYTTLTSAQILALNTTPITIVQSTDANKIIVPVLFLLRFGSGTTNYATNTTMEFGYDTIITNSIYIGYAQVNDAAQTPYRAALVGGTMKEGVDLVAYMQTGNATAGDRDIVVETHYYLIDA